MTTIKKTPMKQKEVKLQLSRLKRLMRKNPEMASLMLEQNPELLKRLEDILKHKADWSKSRLLKAIKFIKKEIKETIVIIIQNAKGGPGKSLVTLLMLQLAILEAVAFPDKKINFAIVSADLNQGLRMILDETFRESALLPPNLVISLVTEQYEDYKPKSSVIINNNLKEIVLEGADLKRYATKNKIEINSTEIGDIYCITDTNGNLIKLDYLVYDLAAGVNDLQCKTATNHFVVASVQDIVSIENALDLLEIKLKEVYENVKSYIIKHDLIEPTHENILMVIQTIKDTLKKDRSSLSFQEKQMIKETGAGVRLSFVHNNKMARGYVEEYKDFIKPELERLNELYQVEIDYIYVPNFNFAMYQESGIPFVIPKEDVIKAKTLRGETRRGQFIEHRADFRKLFQQINSTLAA